MNTPRLRKSLILTSISLQIASVILNIYIDHEIIITLFILAWTLIPFVIVLSPSIKSVVFGLAFTILPIPIILAAMMSGIFILNMAKGGATEESTARLANLIATSTMLASIIFVVIWPIIAIGFVARYGLRKFL